MPLVFDDPPVLTDRLTLSGEDEVKPALGTTIRSAFEVENSLVSAAASGFGPSFEPVRDYNPFADDELSEYEAFADRFVDSVSPTETQHIKIGIDREIENRKVIEAAGIPGFVSMVAAGITDPIFIPLLLAPGGIGLRGTTFLEGATRFGAAELVTESIAEGVKQSTQEVRTGLESAINITGVTLLSGVLGGSVSALTNRQFRALGAEIDDYLKAPLDGEVRSVGAAASDTTTLADQTLVSTGTGLEKIRFSPLLRTANSPSVKSRQTMSQLAESPLFVAAHAEGKAVSGPTGAVETLIKQHDAKLGFSFEAMDQLYVAYRGGGSRRGRIVKDLFGARSRAGQLSYREFREEVGKAMRRGDVHEIPEVAQAAKSFRTRLFDPHKRAAQELGLLPDDVKVTTAPSYLSRVWRTELIKARRPQLREILSSWIKREGGEVDEAADVADQIIDNILGAPAGRVPLALMPGKPVAKAGPLKERVLLIPDDQIEDFLESDVQMIASYYNRSLAPEIELTRRFGEKDLKGALQTIDDDYAQLRNQAETTIKDSRKLEKKLTKLNSRQTDDRRDIQAVRDRMLGTYAMPDDPDSFFYRASNVAKQSNYFSLLGGMTLSAVPDLYRPVMVTGLRPVLGGLHKLITSPARFKMSAREVKVAGTAWDSVLNTRALSLAELTDIYSRQTLLERGLRSLTGAFGVLSLMVPWNATLKQATGVVVAHEVMRQAQNTLSGTITNIAGRKLALSGIDTDMAKRIAGQVEKHGDASDGVTLAQTQLWDDIDAALAFRSAVVKDVDRAIVTPGKAETPLWMSRPAGGLALQFKSFALSSAQKITISGLQQRDMATLNGLYLSLALGGMVYAMKQSVAGREISDDPNVWVMEAVDRSGITGYLFEVNNIIEKGTRGAAGASRLVGGPQMSRYASRSFAAALAGPTLGAVVDVGTSIGAVSTGDVSKADIRAMRRMLPFQNLFYIRRLLDSVESEAAEGLRADQ